MSDLYKYSIVIPHYNSVRLIERMLNSIPEREDIQIIVVDDCSPIDVQEELMHLKHKGLEVVLQKENHGAGYARNNGMEKVLGQWLIVVDADDLFSENAFEVFDRNISSDIDYLCFCVKCVNPDLSPNNYKIASDQSVRKFCEHKDKITERLFKFKNTVCWNKLVSMEYIRRMNIRFEDCPVNNDVLYAIEVGAWSNRYLAISDELYIFVVNEGSITHKKRSIEREFLFYLQAQKRNGIFKKLGYGYPFYRCDMLYALFYTKKRGLLDTIEFFKYRKQHLAEVRTAKEQYLFLLDHFAGEMY